MNVQVSTTHDQYQVREATVRSIVNTILDHENSSGFEVTVVFCGEEKIHEMNKEYLKHDRPTDVIAFPFQEGPMMKGDEEYLGDILVSLDAAFERASDFSQSVEEELSLYIIHGVLHLLGYDDIDPQAKKVMNAKEDNYMKEVRPLVKRGEFICER